MSRTLGLIAALAATGCASFERTDVTQPTVKLDRTQAVSIATPVAGAYEDKQYPQSGDQTARAVQAAFVPHAPTTALVAECTDLECMKTVLPAPAGYVVVPEILHWEDRATEWSGRSDRMELRLSVYQGGTYELLASAIFAAKSGWFSFGGDHPQDLLKEPLEEYVASLY